jgi:hypothetical protein
VNGDELLASLDTSGRSGVDLPVDGPHADGDAVLDLLAVLSPIQYERERCDAAKKLGIRVTALDAAVKRLRVQPARIPERLARIRKVSDFNGPEIVQRPLHEMATDAEDAPVSEPELASETDILGRLVEDLTAAGVVGEDALVKILALACVSRCLPRPISVVVKGTSAAGKSYVTGMVLKTFPAEAYYELTGMSERNLIYDEETLSNRMLVVYEAHGLGGETLQYLIRSLLSEGRLSYKTTERGDDGKYRSRLIEREGPTGMITTTTDVSLHPENETRLLTASVNETPTQTSAVMLALALGDDAPMPNFTRWHELHRWLDKQPNRVTVPFACALAVLMPPVAVRLRRDFTTICNLIKAHAVLHQAHRLRDDEGRIVATVEHDYAPIRDLVADTLAEGVEKRIPKTVRETVSAVEMLICDDRSATTTIRALSKSLKLDRSVVSRRVSRAVALGYLREGGFEKAKGSPMRVGLGEPMPGEGDSDVLPTPKKLAEEFTVRGAA